MFAGLLYAAATYAALPPAGLWPLSIVAALALVFAGCRAGVSGRPSRAAMFAGLGTLPLWFIEESWLMNVTPVGYPLLAIYLAFFSGLTVYMIATVRASRWKVPMSIAAPLVWVACEMLRAEVILTGYPWYLVAHPLIDDPNLCLPGRVLGAYFVCLLLVAAVGSLADAAGWTSVPRRVGGIGAAVVSITWLVTSMIGAAGLSGDAGAQRELNIGVVQTNIPQGQKLSWSMAQQIKDFQRFLELTRALAVGKPSPERLLWPETMFPGWALNPDALATARTFAETNRAQPGSPMRLLTTGYADAIIETQREIDIPMLIGAEAREGARMGQDGAGKPDLTCERRYNSVAIIAKGVLLDERYDKVDLTPFGEVIPWVWRWPFAQRLVLELGAGGMRFDLAFGHAAEAIDVPTSSGSTIRVATPICFEATRSETCRKLVYGRKDGRRADLLVNVSNDGWFGSERWWFFTSDARRRQHLLAGRWRCLELGVPMVRAVNTGLSAFVDSRGRVMPIRIISGGGTSGDQLNQTDAAILGSVMISTTPGRSTPYGRIGNVAGWVGLFGGLALFVAVWINRLRGPRLALGNP